MKTKAIFFYLIVILVSLLASRDLFKSGYFPMHDDLQVGRLYEMDLCFRDKQFPCRWVPDMGYGYGYPLYNYYPPLPYYFGKLVHSLGFSFIDSTKAMFVSGFLISGILMFLFSRKLWGDWGGLLSAVLYLFAPYHSVDVYVRGAMNEHWALAFLPGVCWAIYEIIDKDKAEDSYIFLLALFIGFLLISHNLMTFIFTPVIGIFALLLIQLKKRNFKEKIRNLFFGVIWGFGLAAFFTLPVILEKKYVHVETMLMGYFNFLAHYVPIGKLLFTRYWGYGSSGWLQDAGMPFQVGLPHWPLAVLVFFISAYLLFVRCVRRSGLAPGPTSIRELWLIIFYFFIFIFSLFMVHLRSVVIWNHLPILAYLQFPWRFLTLVIFSISVLGGGIIYLLRNKHAQIFCSIGIVTLTIVLNYSFFKMEKIFPMTDSEKLFSVKGWNKLQTDAIFDYLPIYAEAPPGRPAPSKPEIKEGLAETSEIKKGTNWYSFKVDVKKEAKIQIPIYDFPGWEVKIDNKTTKTQHDNFLGLIAVNVPQGIHYLNAKLTDTPVRIVGNLISLACWIVFLLFLLPKPSLKKR